MFNESLKPYHFPFSMASSPMEADMRASMVPLLCLLLTMSIKLGCCDGQSLKPLCREEDREALLSFKNGIRDPLGKLSSWAGDDCCKWEGVGCHNTTGHVLQLKLRPDFSGNMSLGGEISSSLLELKQLRYLDLSCNDFGGINIPKFLGSISNLRYLNLSSAGFGGVIPPHLGNLFKLHHLDIGNTLYFSSNSLYVEDLEWISNLTSLEFLDMTRVNLSNASNWLQVMNKLPSLSVLHLSSCELHTIDPLLNVNFSSLVILDLSYNYLISSSLDWLANLNSLITLSLASNTILGSIPLGLRNMTKLRFLDLSNTNLVSRIPNWLYDTTTLEHLDLGYNKFEGKIPSDIRNLTSLEYLDLSYNALEGDNILESLANICIFQLSNFYYQKPGKAFKFLSLRSNKFAGPFPDTLGECRSLEILHLGMNRLSGQIPVTLGGISSLRYLNMGENFFKGVISEKHFAGLTSLQVLEASSNPQLMLRVSSDWTPPFQLTYLYLGSWLLGPQFPAWLQSQKYLRDLKMSYAGICSDIPPWFWEGPYTSVDLSHNQIIGNIPSLHFRYVSLSSNNLTGPLPQISSVVEELDLSNNLFRGSLSSMLCQGTGELNSLSKLDVSGNFLSGELPDCWMYWRELVRLDLGNNNLTGHIPSSMGHLTSLGSFHLRNNHLSGKFPLPLKNCTNLQILDLSGNEFTGGIPAWLGNFGGKPTVELALGFYILPYALTVLVLRSNKFTGSIPRELCHLDSLQILDLGNNNLSGTIPRCFGNFSSMSKPSYSSDGFSFTNDNFTLPMTVDIATLVVKGLEYEYRETLGLLVGIDLSSNKLSGDIPQDLTALHGMIFLNLSNNHLQGKIPDKIGGLTLLESLDLSMNSLSGAIPPSLATISFLGHLNLSYNNLSGKIPTGTQMQGFSLLSFMGNPELCGPPLSDDHACPEDIKQKAPTPYKDEEEEEDGWIDMKWLYLGMPWGFVVGFWGILGLLALNQDWRRAYFQRLGGIKYKCLGWCL